MISAENQGRIALRMLPVDIPAGDYIYREHDASEYIWFLHEGACGKGYTSLTMYPRPVQAPSQITRGTTNLPGSKLA